MAETSAIPKKKKGARHWVFFSLRWAVAVVGVWIVVAHMSLHDQALVILDHKSNRPQTVSLESTVPESSLFFPVVDPSNPGRVLQVPRADVLNGPDTKTVVLFASSPAKVEQKLSLLGVDLEGDLNKSPVARRLLVADTSGSARWIPAEGTNYKVHVPYPRDQIGLHSLVHNADTGLLWAALLVFPVTFVITSYRWHELLKALEINISISRTFVLNMVGCFYNTFLPGSTGGDAFKAYYASKQTPHRTWAVMSVLVDRVVGLLALIVVGGSTAALQWQIPACRKVSLAAAAMCLCTGIGLAVFYNRTLHRISGLDFFLRKLPMQKQVRGAVDAMRQYGKRPMLGVWALIVSLPVHGAVVTSAMFAGLAFGLPLHWAYYWVAVPVIVLAGALPLSPQGAGVMEGFAVLLTRTQGVTVSQAFALTMSIRLVQVIWNLVGGLFVLRGGFHAPGDTEKRELENLPPEDGPNGDASPVLVTA
jgi:uncharacterized protein (TIRG00374 family)